VVAPGPVGQEGRSGDAVRAVQEKFVYRNFTGDLSLGLRVDGVFGPRTEQHVRGFQAALAADLPEVGVDGIVGPIMWKALVAGMFSG
jgi:peptidoglycan hydrolase-like protein with peptidoglycan-binding domain